MNTRLSALAHNFHFQGGSGSEDARGSEPTTEDDRIDSGGDQREALLGGCDAEGSGDGLDLPGIIERMDRKREKLNELIFGMIGYTVVSAHERRYYTYLCNRPATVAIAVTATY